MARAASSLALEARARRGVPHQFITIKKIQCNDSGLDYDVNSLTLLARPFVPKQPTESKEKPERPDRKPKAKAKTKAKGGPPRKGDAKEEDSPEQQPKKRRR